MMLRSAQHSGSMAARGLSTCPMVGSMAGLRPKYPARSNAGRMAVVVEANLFDKMAQLVKSKVDNLVTTVTTAKDTEIRFQAIADNYSTLDQVIDALRTEGLESSNLIISVDFTKSNEWTGKKSYRGNCLHQSTESKPGPYDDAIAIIGKALESFDDDKMIPCYGFGDVTTQDTNVFSFLPGDKPVRGMDEVLKRYRQLAPAVKLAGPTSFAPAINNAMRIVADSGNQYHILVIVADGLVSRPSDMPPGQLSPQEKATVKAIVAASELPMSIIMVGVGDGPWDVMEHFDNGLPTRKFDNFQFVNFTRLSLAYAGDLQRMETLFALRALMEVPEQYKMIQRLGLLGQRSGFRSNIRPLDPPGSRWP